MPTLKGFSTKNPEQVKEIMGMIFHKPTPQELDKTQKKDD